MSPAENDSPTREQRLRALKAEAIMNLDAEARAKSASPKRRQPLTPSSAKHTASVDSLAATEMWDEERPDLAPFRLPQPSSSREYDLTPKGEDFEKVCTR